MKKLIIIYLMIMFCMCGCSNQTTERTDIKINLPKDDTVNGYRLEDKQIPDTISKIDVSVDNNSDTTSDTVTSQENNSDKTTVSYLGNKNSKIFHKSTCSSAKKMLDSNKVYLKSADDFLKEGYKSCQRCKP